MGEKYAFLDRRHVLTAIASRLPRIGRTCAPPGIPVNLGKASSLRPDAPTHAKLPVIWSHRSLPCISQRTLKPIFSSSLSSSLFLYLFVSLSRNPRRYERGWHPDGGTTDCAFSIPMALSFSSRSRRRQ